MMFRCDKHCSEKSLSYWQLASVVIDEEGIRRKPLTNVQRRQVVENKAYRGRIWSRMGKEPYVRGMWEYFLQERNRVKRLREQAEEEKQAGIQG